MINDLAAVSDIQKLADCIQDEQNIAKTQDLISLFNWNLSKKNVARLVKLNNLYDAVTDQMATRFENKPDQFSNDDLLNYMKTLQGAIDTSNKQLQNAEQPAPQIIQNNTQINVAVNEHSFSRESRERILAAVQATLKAATTVENIDYEDKTEGDTPNESV